MKIYNYHIETKHYLGSSNADESPLEPGVFLIPASATKIPPPEPQLNKVHVFNVETDYWDTIEDLRGDYFSTAEENIGLYINNQDPRNAPQNVTKEIPPVITPNQKLVWDGDSWQVENAPELSAEEKLQNAGLSVEELKGLLGL
jgi:hypothetical protein